MGRGKKPARNIRLENVSLGEASAASTGFSGMESNALYQTFLQKQMEMCAAMMSMQQTGSLNVGTGPVGNIACGPDAVARSLSENWQHSTELRSLSKSQTLKVLTSFTCLLYGTNMHTIA